jgi:hypothetical protein
MLASTLIASFFVPMFFVILESFSERRGGHKADAPTDAATAADHAGEGA